MLSAHISRAEQDRSDEISRRSIHMIGPVYDAAVAEPGKQRRELYERIARGNALIEVEEKARDGWTPRYDGRGYSYPF